jgi:hypothetical protein
MRIWRDMWPELSVLLALIAMVVGLVLAFYFTH